MSNSLLVSLLDWNMSLANAENQSREQPEVSYSFTSTDFVHMYNPAVKNRNIEALAYEWLASAILPLSCTIAEL